MSLMASLKDSNAIFTPMIPYTASPAFMVLTHFYSHILQSPPCRSADPCLPDFGKVKHMKNRLNRTVLFLAWGQWRPLWLAAVTTSWPDRRVPVWPVWLCVLWTVALEGTLLLGKGNHLLPKHMYFWPSLLEVRLDSVLYPVLWSVSQLVLLFKTQSAYDR